MKTVMIRNRTRMAISLPGLPPFAMGDRKNPVVNLADLIIAPGGRVEVRVRDSDLDAVSISLHDLMDRGVISMCMECDSCSILPDCMGIAARSSDLLALADKRGELEELVSRLADIKAMLAEGKS